MSDHDDIVIALRRISRATELLSRQLFRESGLTVPQLLVMQAIAREGAPPTSRIARHICVSQATVTRIIDRLERDGLVARCKSTADRRVVNIRLTEAGHQKLVQARPPLQPGFVEKLDALADWEQAMLKASLMRISRMMDTDGVELLPVIPVNEAAASPLPGEK